jgi:hypothetical protein
MEDAPVATARRGRQGDSIVLVWWLRTMHNHAQPIPSKACEELSTQFLFFCFAVLRSMGGHRTASVFCLMAIEQLRATTRIPPASGVLLLIDDLFFSASLGPLHDGEIRATRRVTATEPHHGGARMLEAPYTLAQQTVIISAFRGGVAVDVIAEVVGKTLESVEDLLAKVGLKTHAAETSEDDDEPELSQAAVAERYRQDDLAFQKAMHRAIRRGLERPPIIGMFKDDTLPNHYHQSFVPPALYSGCSSPAQQCAELCSPFD